jgi:hypothetical protein
MERRDMKNKVLLIIFGVFLLCGISFAENLNRDNTGNPTMPALKITYEEFSSVFLDSEIFLDSEKRILPEMRECTIYVVDDKTGGIFIVRIGSDGEIVDADQTSVEAVDVNN